jgi:iron complex outermembrane recepter protein
MKNSLTRSALAAAIIATLPYQLSAQENEEILVLEEVLVTARKREESLQDVSVAVSAVSSSALIDAQIRDSTELTKLVPSLTMGDGNGQSFVVRGVGTQAFSAGVEPSVATMIDGVVLGRSNQSFMQLVDIQRVEVLRGPQGTLFGKNSSAGVVHFITKDPTSTFDAEVTGTAVERGEYRLGATISGPITDDLGARLTYGGVRDDGYLTNVYDGEKYGGGDSDTFRFKLRWTPSSTLDFKWSSDYASEDDAATVRPLRIVNDPVIAEEILPVVASEENYRVNLDGDIFRDTESSGHSLEFNWDIGEFTLTSITAYRDYERDGSADNDGRPTNKLDFSQVSHNESDQFTQELRVSSPISGSLYYVAGLYAFLQTTEQELTREIFALPTSAELSVDTTNYAAFGELTYEFTDSLRGVFGGRYTYDELEYEHMRVGIFPPSSAPFEDGTDDTDFSGKLSLEWDATDESMLFATYAEGYKGQAYNVAYGTTPPLEPVDPELATAYELGYKSRLLDGRLIFNAVLFLTDYDDFQGQTQVDDGDNTAFFLTNAGEVRTQGLELDFTGLVSENLTVFGGVSLIDASIEDFEDGPCSQGQKYRDECPESGAQDLSGGDLPFSPDWKISLNANYTIPLDSMPFDLVAKLAYQGQDDMLTDISQDRYTIQDSYHVFDLALTMDANDGTWDVTAFVKNIGDESYARTIVSNQIQFNPGGYGHHLPKTSRRTAGVEVRYRWY